MLIYFNLKKRKNIGFSLQIYWTYFVGFSSKTKWPFVYLMPSGKTYWRHNQWIEERRGDKTKDLGKGTDSHILKSLQGTVNYDVHSFFFLSLISHEEKENEDSAIISKSFRNLINSIFFQT